MESGRIHKLIEDGVAQLGQQLPDGGEARLTQLVSELDRWSDRVNLTAIRNPAEMVSSHLIDSLSIRPMLHGRRIHRFRSPRRWRRFVQHRCGRTAAAELGSERDHWTRFAFTGR